MTTDLIKVDFKKKFKMSESTYQRRMKLFKESPFRSGYKPVTSKEIWIDVDLYHQFKDWLASNSLRVRKEKEEKAS